MRKFPIPRRWGIAFACVIGMLLSTSAISQAESPDAHAMSDDSVTYDSGLSPEQNEVNQEKMATAREGEPVDKRVEDKVWSRAENELDNALTRLGTAPSTGRPLLGEASYLDHGVIGFIINEETQKRTIVLTEGTRPNQVLEHETLVHLSPEALDLIEFELTDRTADGLAQVWWVVRDHRWVSPDKGSVEFHLDPETRSVLVRLGPSIDHNDESALRRLAPDYLTIERFETEIEFLTDRHNDVPPQWGGAQLALNKNGPRHCTSGFTVKGKTTGTRYSLTAGHCVADFGGNGVNFWSGPYSVGQSAGYANFPTRDAVRLKNSNYGSLIWTDGLTSTTTGQSMARLIP